MILPGENLQRFIPDCRRVYLIVFVLQHQARYIEYFGSVFDNKDLLFVPLRRASLLNHFLSTHFRKV